MTIKSMIYDRLPKPVGHLVRRGYRRVSSKMTGRRAPSEFVDEFFHSREQYSRYVDEFEQGPAVDLRNEALERYQQLTGETGLAGIGLDTARDYYAITRSLKPTTVVETGVCNGVSTLSILLALHENGGGRLHSIDYPLRADESLEEFRRETFEDYGGAAIPRDKEPGWIIPDELKSRWELTLGKSQRKLPGLFIELKAVDLFIHDSEHSHPCMMFEYELAHEWLNEGGVILSDDITWNEAFSVFTRVRDVEYGYLSSNVGYMRKSRGR